MNTVVFPLSPVCLIPLNQAWTDADPISLLKPGRQSCYTDTDSADPDYTRCTADSPDLVHADTEIVLIEDVAQSQSSLLFFPGNFEFPFELAVASVGLQR